VRRTRTALIAGVAAALLTLIVVPAAMAQHAAPLTPTNCLRDQLGVRPNGSNGAAGTIFSAWVFTNVSHATCRLYGYPGMQLYGRAGRPIPTTVKRNLSPGPSNVSLAPGASATFFSSYSDVSSGPKPCTTSAVIAITPPNATASLFIPARLEACRGVVNVSAVRAGIHHT
jgi:Protein of unknown function (DUF4232)